MSKYSSLGSYLQVNTGAALVDIAQIVSLTAPGVNRQFEDVTALDSANSFAEYRAVVNEPTEVTGQLIFDPNINTHAFLMNSAANTSMPAESWKLYLNDGFTNHTNMTFTGSLARWEPRLQGRETIKVDFSIRVSAAWTWAVGT